MNHENRDYRNAVNELPDRALTQLTCLAVDSAYGPDNREIFERLILEGRISRTGLVNAYYTSEGYEWATLCAECADLGIPPGIAGVLGRDFARTFCDGALCDLLGNTIARERGAN